MARKQAGVDERANVTTEEAGIPLPASIPSNPNQAPSEYEDLKSDLAKIQANGVGPLEAESLAAKFLRAQLSVSEQIQVADLDARLKKAGLETMESQVLLDEIKKHEKKPSDSILTATVATHPQVTASQQLYFDAITQVEALKRLYDILGNGHIFCRGIAKANL